MMIQRASPLQVVGLAFHSLNLVHHQVLNVHRLTGEKPEHLHDQAQLRLSQPPHWLTGIIYSHPQLDLISMALLSHRTPRDHVKILNTIVKSSREPEKSDSLNMKPHQKRLSSLFTGIQN